MTKIVYQCKHCGMKFVARNWEYAIHLDENLWGHIQMNHEDIFEEVQDFETPAMINEVYIRTIYKKGSHKSYSLKRA